MKKFIAAAIAAALLTLAACSGGETQESTISSNKAFSPDAMVNTAGEEQSLADASLFGSEALGMAFIVPEAWYEVPTERINQREDDSEATVQNRLRVYEAPTQPLIDYYAASGLLKTVDGDGAIDAVEQAIVAAVERA